MGCWKKDFEQMCFHGFEIPLNHIVKEGSGKGTKDFLEKLELFMKEYMPKLHLVMLIE